MCTCNSIISTVTVLFSFPELSENNVALNIIRRGQLGVVFIAWEAGLPGSKLVNGSIIPTSGIETMDPEDISVTIELSVSFSL